MLEAGTRPDFQGCCARLSKLVVSEPPFPSPSPPEPGGWPLRPRPSNRTPRGSSGERGQFRLKDSRTPPGGPGATEEMQCHASLLHRAFTGGHRALSSESQLEKCRHPVPPTPSPRPLSLPAPPPPPPSTAHQHHCLHCQLPHQPCHLPHQHCLSPLDPSAAASITSYPPTTALPSPEVGGAAVLSVGATQCTFLRARTWTEGQD